MARIYKPIDLAKVTTYSVGRRHHKATVGAAARLPEVGATAAALLDSFPAYFGAAALKSVVSAVVAAVRGRRPVVLALGAHVIKVGCSPIVIDLIRRGIVKAIACNGACAIHDMELATLGETSEEVADTIRDGSFGMVTETMSFFESAVALAAERSLGLGESVGRLLVKQDARYIDQSIFAAAHQASIPITAHVALGTDTIHMAPGVHAAALGEASMRDFRLICDVVSDLGSDPDGGGADGSDPKDGAGGVWINIGSAVLLPEVFLKAVSVARNLGADLDAMTTANFDMIRHYRPSQNVLTRPVAAGRGHEVVGHHEILLPLFRQAIIETLESASLS